MTSEKRAEANRRNSQRSTGPRTVEGKKKSRGNSLKHGLTGAGVVVAGRDSAEVKAAYECLAETLAPTNNFEAMLVGRMAVAGVRMNRYERVDAARRNIRKQRAVRNWHARQERQRDEGIKLLEHNAAKGYQLLTASSLGCAWITAQWRKLDEKLDELTKWSVVDFAQAIRLGGREPNCSSKTAGVAMVRLAFLAIQSKLDYDFADSVTGERTANMTPEVRSEFWTSRLPTREQALDHLRRHVTGSINWMFELGERLKREVEAPEQADYATIAELDSSPSGMRLARYDAMNEQALHRNWTALFRLRKQGPESVGIESPEPIEPEAQNEPNEEPSSSDFTGTCVNSHECASTSSGGASTAPKGSAPPEQPRTAPAETVSEPPKAAEGSPPGIVKMH